MDGCGPLRRCETPAEWLDFNKRLLQRETLPNSDLVTSTQYIYVRENDRRIVGMLQIRHELNGYLQWAGHIGYSVRPVERRKGYATAMLQAALPVCRELGLTRIMIACLTDSEGSRRTILNNGGVYAQTVLEPRKNVALEQYWIAL